MHGGAVVYGTLLGVQAIGSLLGGLAIAQFGKKVTPARLLGVCSCLFGLIDLLIVDLPIFVKDGVLLLVGLLFVFVGIPGVGAMVSMETLFQTIIEDHLLGRVFGAIQAVNALMILIGIILAGLLGDRFGPVLLNIQGSAYFLTGILAMLTLSRMLLKRQVMSRESVSE